MPTELSSDIQILLRHGHARASAALPDLAAFAYLHLGPMHSGLAVGARCHEPDLLALDLGLNRLAERYFKTSPPSALSLEHAIMVVEDLVMPLAAHLPRGCTLCSGDEVLWEVARFGRGYSPSEGQVPVFPSSAGQPLTSRVLPLEEMEHSFNRLADVVGGRPAALESLPASGTFAAALLVLRECMHHWHAEQLVLLEPS